MHSDIVIIGAGIGGLTTALALQRQGFRPRVFEKSPEVGDIGAGIMLTPNSVKCLKYIGLESALVDHAIEPLESVYREYDTAKIILSAPLKDTMEATYGAKYFHIHRADLLSILSSAVLHNDANAIQLGYNHTYSIDKVSYISSFFENMNPVKSDIVIGCDGIHSVVRKNLFGDEEARYTGQVAWRGMVPSKTLPKSINGQGSVSWLGRNKHIIHYGVRNEDYINYVAIVAENQWTEDGWVKLAEVSELLDQFKDWHSDVRQLLSNTPKAACYKWGLFDRKPLINWTNGRTTLLGDAAHPMLPFMAQGSAMAIEDAIVLARSLSNYTNVEKAFLSYQNVRLARANRLVEKSRGATKVYQNPKGDKEQQRAESIREVYGYDATTVII